jgi:enoyl-CoA hydratase/carnithine racemase
VTPGRPEAGGDAAETLLRDLAALGGAGAEVVDLRGGDASSKPGAGVVRIGVCRGAGQPVEGLEAYDILLCDDPAAPRPWVGLPGAEFDAALAALERQITRHPVAAAVCAQVLRASERVSFDEAVAAESIAYSMLLASAEFRAWRAANPPRARLASPEPRVLIEEDGGGLALRLNRPAARNAFDARMRDELCEALQFALDHPDAPSVILSGLGPAFSAGGDLDEFGQAEDVGRAHLVRVLRSPARLVRQLGQRITVRVHGACIGAGIEVPAAAGRVVATPNAVFRLPEVSMGLIPGAGGTAGVPRRIGRARACFMAISGAEIDAATALAWGLVDAVEGP